jgi:pimeloyl-ACP methyl ester carboxylesterase
MFELRRIRVSTITSKDGTQIAYDKQVSGPLVVLVPGALGSRSCGPMVGLMLLLSNGFTVVLYDRRGRGDNGDMQPFEKEREIEDIEALINNLGGSAYLYGTSSGAAVTAVAASTLGAKKATKLALYEPSYILDNSHAPIPSNYLTSLAKC